MRCQKHGIATRALDAPKSTRSQAQDGLGLRIRQVLMIANPYLQSPGINARPPGVPSHGTTCKFSGSYQVVMSSEIQKLGTKNKQHA